MNRLRSIIALQVYVCMCGVCGTLFKTKRERERESFDLSECIWFCRKGTVVVAVEKKRRKTPSVKLADRKSMFFILHPTRLFLALRSLWLDIRLHLFFVRCSSVQHFSGPCHSMLSLSLSFFFSLSVPYIKNFNRSIVHWTHHIHVYEVDENWQLTSQITLCILKKEVRCHLQFFKNSYFCYAFMI